MFWIPLAIGAAVGAAKNAQEAQQAAAERKRQAEVTRYSPWTGMTGQTVKDPSLIGNMAQGAAAGGSLGQAYTAANAAPAATTAATEYAPATAAASPSLMSSPSLSQGLNAMSMPNRMGLMNTSLSGSAGALSGAGAGNTGISLNGLNNNLFDPNDPYGQMARMYASSK